MNLLTKQVGTGFLRSEDLCRFQETLECSRCFHMFPCLCIVHPQESHPKTWSRIAQPPTSARVRWGDESHLIEDETFDGPFWHVEGMDDDGSAGSKS